MELIGSTYSNVVAANYGSGNSVVNLPDYISKDRITGVIIRSVLGTPVTGTGNCCVPYIVSINDNHIGINFFNYNNNDMKNVIARIIVFYHEKFE